MSETRLPAAIRWDRNMFQQAKSHSQYVYIQKHINKDWDYDKYRDDGDIASRGGLRLRVRQSAHQEVKGGSSVDDEVTLGCGHCG